MKLPKHGRRLVLSAVSLVPGRVRSDIQMGEDVRDELEALMDAVGFLENAPFTWIGLMLRYGTRDQETPEYGAPDVDEGELAVAIELDMQTLRSAPPARIREVFRAATMRVLEHVAKKFGLPKLEATGES